LPLGPGRGPGSSARIAGDGSANGDFFLATHDRLFEREPLLDSKVGSLTGPLLAPALRPSATDEELRKQVLELGEDVAHPPTREVEPSAVEASVTELIVASPLLPIGQNSEGFRGFLAWYWLIVDVTIPHILEINFISFFDDLMDSPVMSPVRLSHAFVS